MDAILSSLVSVAEWTFLTSAKATVVIGLVLLSQKIFNRWLSARGRYALWFAVVVCLAVPFNVESKWSVFSAHSLYTALSQSVPVPILDARGKSGTESSSVPVSYGSGIVEPTDHFRRKTETSVPSTFAPFHAIPWYVALWLVVGIGLTCLTLYNQIRYLRLRAAACHVDESTRALLTRCRKDMGLHRHIHVFETLAVTSPSVFGCIAPTLLLPEGLQHELSERDLRHVFLHELAHVKRHDVFLNWVTMYLQILHWFNPAIWYGFSRMRSDREQACDARVLERLPTTEWREYGNTLINLTDSYPTSVSLARGVGIVESQKRMKARLQMIGRFRLFTRRHALTPAVLLALLVTIALTKASAQEDAYAVSTAQSIVGVGPAWKTLKREVGFSYKGTVSHHLMKNAYPTVLAWSDPGDTFVFMFAFDVDEQRPPDEYHDMLPKPWTEIESRAKQGERVELSGEARGLHVVVLAARTTSKLEALIRSTALLDKAREVDQKVQLSRQIEDARRKYDEVRRSHQSGQHAHKKYDTADTLPNLFVMGSHSADWFRNVWFVLGDSVYNKTGRNHTKENYDSIWDGTHNRSTNDLMVLLFTLDSRERIPEEYSDLLPRPWEEIEVALRNGETINLEGWARDVQVILLAAPDASKLKRAVLESKLLHGYKASYQKSLSPAIDLALASDAVKLTPYDEGNLYSAVAAIRNTGTKESPTFGVHFVLTRGEDANTKSMTHGAGPIWPDDHWNEMSMPFALEEGINDIAVIVDPDDAVFETNETNNRASLRVVVKGGKIVESTTLRG